jgi:hypothetical protein
MRRFLSQLSLGGSAINLKTIRMLISLRARFLFSQAGNMHIRPHDIALWITSLDKAGVARRSGTHRGGEG